MNQNFTKVETDDTDEPDEEDADEIPEEDPIIDKEPLRRVFGSTLLIWLIGFVIVGIAVYRVMRRN
jgi:hypothetical protein